MPTGDGYNAELGTLSSGSQQMVDANELVKKEINGLLERLEPLTRTWQSSAADRFHQIKTGWHAAVEEHNKKLHGISQGLQQTRLRYDTSDNDTEEELHKLQNTFLDGMNPSA